MKYKPTLAGTGRLSVYSSTNTSQIFHKVQNQCTQPCLEDVVPDNQHLWKNRTCPHRPLQTEDVCHFLLECSAYQSQRDELLEQIYIISHQVLDVNHKCLYMMSAGGQITTLVTRSVSILDSNEWCSQVINICYHVTYI